ncbi:HNH endonuclease [Sphingorhabdus lacus]|uniref:HNH endonuclease n=1 Tax=Sphingorhabdus lacus TaxID=392610 RepID=UPI003593D644
MWRFDQGRIEYFQFDELRKIAKYAVANDLRSAKRQALVQATGLPFYPASDAYPPWRNYSRVFRTALLVAKINEVAVPTKIAHLLAADGQVTSDDYFHFLAQTFTDPAPSFQEWRPSSEPRFPLLFALKFLLARSVTGSPVVTFPEIVGAYIKSKFDGEEDQAAFIGLAKKDWTSSDHRQARESIQIIGQISYLSATSTEITVSLDDDDALDIFEALHAVRGKQETDSEKEILRIANLFESAIADFEIDFSKTVLDETVEAGFSEGNRVERTHIVLERNAAIRKAFFDKNPTTICDFCKRDTKADYPWSERVLDIHHVLPLCSGTRSDRSGTILGDLEAVCPTCHRAVHHFYTKWLKAAGQKDFADADEARSVYDEAKQARKNG